MHIYHNREKVFLCDERHTGGVPSRSAVDTFPLGATILDQNSNPGEKMTFGIFSKHFLAFSESLLTFLFLLAFQDNLIRTVIISFILIDTFVHFFFGPNFLFLFI